MYRRQPIKNIFNSTTPVSVCTTPTIVLRPSTVLSVRGSHLNVGERFYPFSNLTFISDVECETAWYTKNGGVETQITVGTNTDLLGAVKLYSEIAFFGVYTYTLKFVLYDSTELIATVQFFCGLSQYRDYRVANTTNPTQLFSYVNVTPNVSAVKSASYEISGPSTVSKRALPHSYKISGTHNTANNSILVDSNANFPLFGVLVNDKIKNITSDNVGTITALTATTITHSGGFTWATNDEYAVYDSARIIQSINSFTHTFTSVGLHTATLYVVDQNDTETSIEVLVDVVSE